MEWQFWLGLHPFASFVSVHSFCLLLFSSDVQFWLAGACTVKPVANVVFLHVFAWSCVMHGGKTCPIVSTLWMHART